MLAKTLKLLTVILLLCICKADAQITAAAAAPATLPFTREVDSVFQNLNKSYITTGILYDRIYPFAALHVFNTTAADTSFRGHFRQGYYELYNAAYNNSTFTMPDTVNKRVAGIIKAGKVPIAIFNYQFNQVDTNALADNLISSTNGLYYDVAGRPRSPYWLKQISVISPMLDSVTGLQVAFQTATNLFFQNTGRTILSLKADFGNGSGLLTISTNGVSTINYTTYGTKVIKFVITYNDNTQRTTYGKIKVVQGIAGTTGITTPCDKLDSFFAAIPFTDYENNTYKGKGQIYYYFATNTTCNGKVRKPVIVLDGFDPQDERSIGKLYENYLNNPARYQFADELRSKGFDIVVLNFPVYVNSLGKEVDGGTEYIERNAFVLVELINKLKAELQSNGSAEKIRIVGPSMGGLISRYALAYMEKNNMAHNVGIWISFDAPHNGANIPIGAQRFLEFFAGNGNNDAQDALNHQLDNPAAKQMLLHHFKTTSTGLAQGAPNFRDRFVTALTSNGMTGSNGFPTIPRKVSIVNGSLNGTLQPGVGACQKALDMTSNLTFKWMFLFKVKLFRVAKADIYFAGSYGNSCKVFDGSQLFKKPREDYGYAPSTSVSYDIAPGGTFNTLKILADEAGDSTFGFSTQLLLNILLFKYGIYGTNTSFNTYKETHCFIPTKSALAFTGANKDLAENVYERNLVCTGETPFHTYYGPLTNLEHVYINTDIAKFAIDEIKGTQRQPTYLTTIPGLTISGPGSFCPEGTYTLTGGTIPSGTSIVWNPGSSIATIASGQGTPQVKLSRVSNGSATLSVSLTKTCSVNQSLSTAYSIGGPAISISYFMNGPCNGSTQTWSLNATSPNTVTSWQWTKDPSATGNWYIHNPSSPSTLVDVSSGGGGISVTATNSCGSTRDGVTIWSNCSTMITASPNPTTDYVTVAVAEPKDAAAASQQKAVLYQINVADMSGNVRRQYRYPGGVRNTVLSLSGLIPGTYTIQAFDGTSWSSVQVVKQ